MIHMCESLQIFTQILAWILIIYRYLKEEILSFKMVPYLWKSVKNWGHRSYFIALFLYFGVWLKNQWESISDLFENY